MSERQRRLKIGYDIVKETIEILEKSVGAEYGAVDYKKVHYLSAAYTMQDYFANELVSYPESETAFGWPDE
jgi:hypothetical protein